MSAKKLALPMARNATSAGSACTKKIESFAVQAPKTPAMTTQLPMNVRFG